MTRAMRAVSVQAAVVAVLVGVMLVLLGGGGVTRRPEPSPARSARPATEQERRQWEADQLAECLRDIDWCRESGLATESR